MEFVSRSEITVPMPEMAALEQAFAERAHFVYGHAGWERRAGVCAYVWERFDLVVASPR
jgi:hypothetical protein